MSEKIAAASAVKTDTAATGAGSACYHCGLPITAPAQFTVATQEGIAPVCCPGCKAVVETINASGLQNYYRYRDRPGENPGRSASTFEPAQRTEFAYLDQPEFAARWTTQNSDGTRRCELLIGGMHCAACVWLLETTAATSVRRQNRVHRFRRGGRGTVEWNSAQVQLGDICAAIAAIGYQPEPYRRDRNEQLRQHEQRTMLRRLGVAGIGMMQSSACSRSALYARRDRRH